MMNLRLITQTTNTITLGWDKVVAPGGFRFSSELGGPPTYTRDPDRVQVKFAKGSAWYKVEAFQAIEAGTWPLQQPFAALPVAPAPYDVPLGKRVTDYASLKAEIALGTPTITLAPGIYDGPNYLTPKAGQYIISEVLLGAEVRCGIEIRNPGVIIRGIKGKYTKNSIMLQNCGIHIWDKGYNWNIADCEFRGTDDVSAGVYAYLEGSAQRLVIGQFHNYGFRLAPFGSTSTYLPAYPALVEDVYAEDCVWRTNPCGSNGTAEVPIWIGMRSTVRRVHAHQNPSYASGGSGSKPNYGGLAGGVWTGTNCDASRFDDVTVSGALLFGVYNEHFSRNCIWTKFYCAPSVTIGWHVEWADPAWGGVPGAVNTMLDNYLIEASCIGVNLDEGSANIAIKNGEFKGQAWAAINDYKTVGCTYPADVVVMKSHYYDAPCAGPGS